MLTRKERVKITAYVLKKMYPKCVSYKKKLFADQDAMDLLDEVGVQVWIALIRYRRKPYKEAIKLAYRTATNQLNSLVRTKITVKKRGAGSHTISLNTEENDEEDNERYEGNWMSDPGLYSNGIKIVDAIELICSSAIFRVGTRKADALVKALLYDWRLKRTNVEQRKLMKILNRDRKEVRKLVNSFSRQMKKQIGPEETHSYPIQKVDGIWKHI